jgi:16S rRNA (cytidine1402-2'-O)-methyltransferase
VSGTLYVVATPIGNLSDITLRALEVLRGVDGILAEDTRTTARLLKRFSIERRLRPLHEYSPPAQIEAIVQELRGGRSLAYVTEAGTPSISDPGARLVGAARAGGVAVAPIPGPSALTAAWSVAGLQTPEFRFVSFLPSSPKLRRRRLRALAAEDVPLVLYEAPHRAARMLADLVAILGDRRVFLARELTKVHEQTEWTTAAALLERFRGAPPRGEITLVVSPAGAGPE